tara:strand:- start:321 stop:701 length:381 start_codon:yes stop_codon:yes gene_type:complete
MGRPINPSKIGQGTGKIRCTAYRFTGASEATAPAAYITKQVSTSKFTVTDGTTTETLVLSDLAQGALTAGTFIVEGVLDDSTRVQVTKLRNRTVQYDGATNAKYTLGGTDKADHSTSDSLVSIEIQ